MNKPKGLTLFLTLTGMRAIAAYSVFIHHYNPLNRQTGGDLLYYYCNRLHIRSVLFDLLNELHIGVTIFFVLSGFLIAYRYIDSFKINKAYFKQYAVNRVAKIYPMYFLTTLLAFINQFSNGVFAGRPRWGLMLLLANITFIRGFFDELKFTGVSQGWTLTVEECFYFLAPFIFYFYYHYRKLFLQPLAFIVFGILMTTVFMHLNFYGFFGSYKFMWHYTFFGHCFEFYTGIQLALVIKQNRKIFADRLPCTWMGIAGIVFCLFGFVFLKYRIPGYNFGSEHPLAPVINNGILPVFIVFLFYGLLTEETFVRRVLSSGPLVLLGKSSYCFYLIHLGILEIISSKIVNSVAHGFTAYVLLFLMLNAIAIALFKIIEEPVNNYLRRVFKSYNLKAQPVIAGEPV